MNENHVEQSGATPLDYAGPDVPDPAPPERGAAERGAGGMDGVAHVDLSALELVPSAVEAGADVVSAFTESSSDLAGGIFDAIAGAIG